jgi:hypothetical protein
MWEAQARRLVGRYMPFALKLVKNKKYKNRKIFFYVALIQYNT